MATTVSTPQVAYLAAPLAAYGNSATVWATATVFAPGVWDMKVEFQGISQATVSLPFELRVFQSSDAGATFDTFANPYTARTIARAVSSAEKVHITLPGGYYAFAACIATPVTGTILMGTVEVNTAVISN